MFAVIRVVRGEASYEKKGVRIFEGNALLANRQGVARIFEHAEVEDGGAGNAGEHGVP